MKNDGLEDFRQQCERNLRRSVAERMRYGFNYVYKPVLDDTQWRSFESMAEYRRWCDENLPSHLGYGTSEDIDQDALDRQTAFIARREIDRRRKNRT